MIQRDGSAAIAKAARKYYPNALQQECVIHLEAALSFSDPAAFANAHSASSLKDKEEIEPQSKDQLSTDD